MLWLCRKILQWALQMHTMGINFFIFLALSVFKMTMLFSSNAEKVVLNPYQTAVLNVFFKTLVEESEAGFVFFGKKPVSIHGFYENNISLIDFPFHRERIAYLQGERLIEDLSRNTNLKNSNIRIYICKNEDPLIRHARHILTINVPAFHKIIDENLPLFQHVLGPTTTSKKLLDSLLIDNVPFHALLKYDNVLAGKLLGYGTQNSLYGSRIELIEQKSASINPPYMNEADAKISINNEYFPLRPSIGYESLSDELQDLQKNLVVSSKPLIHEKPSFIYGRLSDCKNEYRIDELEKTQKKIQNHLNSNSFLEKILETLFEKPVSVDRSPFRFDLRNIDKEKKLAEAIYNEIKTFEPTYLSFFYNGLTGHDREPLDSSNFHPSLFTEFKNAKQNLTEVNKLFSKPDTYKTIIENKLLFKIKKPGTGEGIRSNYAKMSYVIYSSDNDLLGSKRNVVINLNNTIPGFRLGVKDMKAGEKRKLRIHPEFAYGIETVKNDKFLKVMIDLIEIIEDPKAVALDNSTDPIESLDYLFDPKIEESYNESYKTYLLNKGKMLRNRLIDYPSISLEKVVVELTEMGKKQNPTETRDNEIIDKLFWNIYFGPHASKS